MALTRVGGLGLKLGLFALGAAGVGTAVHATADVVDAPTAQARLPLSAGLMPVCGPGALVNVAQAALGDPRPTGPATPAAAVLEFADVVGIVLPAGALEQVVPLSDHEALVQGPVSAGHVVRHGNHWQADYLAACVPAALPPVPLPQVPALPVPSLPAIPTPGIPSVPLPAPDVPTLSPGESPSPTSASPPLPTTGLGQ